MNECKPLLTGRITAESSVDRRLRAGGLLGAQPSPYANTIMDHYCDVNRLEEALWEMKRRKVGRCRLTPGCPRVDRA